MNLTRERIRQVEVKGLAKLAALRDMLALRDYVDEGPMGKRRLPVLAAPIEEDEDEDETEDVAADDEGAGDTVVTVDVSNPEVGDEFDMGEVG
jgi:DNA-directed RNA polymerase sigma subunit (sigma70/sigma32)